jgi:hypothetical protein
MQLEQGLLFSLPTDRVIDRMFDVVVNGLIMQVIR